MKKHIQVDLEPRLQLFRTSNHNLWPMPRNRQKKRSLQCAVKSCRAAGGRWKLASGKRQPAVRSRPHNYRFDLWQHFCSQLLRTRQAQNKKKRNPKRKSHGMCLFPCPCHCCRPRADSMPSPGLRASEITFITDKGGPSCSCYRRAKARHLQLSIQCNLLLCSRT